jgi:Flp pilus assembly protein TadD
VCKSENIRQALVTVVSLLALSACAGHSTKETVSDTTTPGPCEYRSMEERGQPEPAFSCVFRRDAWLEGEVQTGYEPDRNLAEEKLKKTESSVPDQADTEKYLEYLSLLDASGRASKAEAEIKAYLFKHPHEKRALFLLGVHYMRAKKKDLAQYFFSQLEKDAKFPAKSVLFNNLGMLALGDGNRPEAIEYFEKATKAEPPTAAPFVNLGALYLQSHSYADAEKMFTRAHEIDGDFEDAILGLGSALEGLGKFAEAHNAYTSYMQGHSDALSVLYNDATILGNRLKQKELASQEMLRYIQRGGRESAKAHENLQNWR